MHRTTSIVASVTLGLLVAASAAPQAVVLTLARDLEPLTETADVRCSRFASFQDEPRVVVGMALEPGDLLASVSGDVALELECPGGSLLRFTGGFRVIVDVPVEDETDCAVNFLSGTVDVLTDRPTEVNAGGVVLGSEGTQYSVELARDAEGADWKCMVYDGRVRWRTLDIETRWLETGTLLRATGLRPTEERISEVAIDPQALSRAALRYARFDVVKSRAQGVQVADPGTAVRELSTLHYEVLARPADVDRRVVLAKKQLDYRVMGQASYNLDRAGVRTEQEMRSYQIDPSRILRVPPPPRVVIPPGGFDRVVPATPDAMALVEARRYDDAVAHVREKAEAGTANSRDYCALAMAYQQLGDGRSSAAAARLAVSHHRRDGKLSDPELATCKRLAEGH